MTDIFHANDCSNTHQTDALSSGLSSANDLFLTDAGASTPNALDMIQQAQPVSSDAFSGYSTYASEPFPSAHPDDLSARHPALSFYTDLQPIGSGAQGTMLRATAPDGTKVAIKVFDIQKADDIKSLELFEREVDTLKNINVSGVPKFITDIRTMQYRYLIEEYIDAPSLEKRMKKGQRFRFTEIIKILSNAAKILDELYAYIPPIVHRDIKPANLLVDDDQNVWLVDFGVVAAKSPESFAMTFAGTAGYLAPEQLYGKATPASDVFSLGVTIAHLITQKAPCDMCMDGVKLDIDQHIPANVPDWFKCILNKMIAPNPADRYQNGRQLLETLQEAQNTGDHLNEKATPSPQTAAPKAYLPEATQSDDSAPNHEIPDHAQATGEAKGIDDDENGTDDDENGTDDDENGTDDDENGIDDDENDQNKDVEKPNQDADSNITNNTPRETTLKDKIKDIYMTLPDIVSDYCLSIVALPIFFAIPAFLIFFLFRAALFDANMHEFFISWLPAVFPFCIAICGAASRVSCINDSDYNQKIKEYQDRAIELNQIYADELKRQDSTKEANLPNFSEFKKIISDPMYCVHLPPLTPKEDKRLDTYIQQHAGPYPCLAFKPYTEDEYSSYIIRPVIFTIISILITYYITKISELHLVWTIISLIIYALSFIGFFKYLKYIFTDHIRRIHSSRYIDAHQLYLRRFVNELKASKPS